MDPNGSLTSSPKYDVYGLVRSNSGTASSKMGFVGSLGHLSEANTGLIYMKARYYDPQQGRFSSEDMTGHGANWYTYAENNPINEVDCDGHIPAWIVARLIGGISGLCCYLMLCAVTHQKITAELCVEAFVGGALIGVGMLFAGGLGAGMGMAGVASLMNTAMTLGELAFALVLLADIGFMAGAIVGVGQNIAHRIGDIIAGHEAVLEIMSAETDFG